jgi:hypothetical protein
MPLERSLHWWPQWNEEEVGPDRLPYQLPRHLPPGACSCEKRSDALQALVAASTRCYHGGR